MGAFVVWIFFICLGCMAILIASQYLDKQKEQENIVLIKEVNEMVDIFNAHNKKLEELEGLPDVTDFRKVEQK